VSFAPVPEPASGRQPSAAAPGQRARAAKLARGALAWLGAHKRTVRVVALGLIALFVLLAVKRAWDGLPRGYVWHVRWPLLALGWLLLVAQELSFALIWRDILARLGSRLAIRPAQQIYLGSEFVRYIPGNVWHVLTRIVWAERRGVPRVTGLASMTIELATKIAGAALLFALSLLLWRDVGGLKGWLGQGLPLALGIVGVPLLLVGLHPRVLTGALNAGLRALGRQPVSFALRYRDILWITLLWTLSWVVAGAGFYLLVLALQPSDFALAALGIAAGIYACGWDIGFLSFITPSGFGFREGALALLLGLAGIVPVAAVGVAIAIVARLAVTAAELVCVAGAHFLPGGQPPEVGEATAPRTGR
jgi:glycosyltransferase 2 family protein